MNSDIFVVAQYFSDIQTLMAARAACPNFAVESLFFVPAGVGVIAYLGLLSQYSGKLLLVIVLSTWTGLAVTALELRALLGRGHE